MCVQFIYSYLVLRSGPLIESHFHFISFVFLRFSSLFLLDGDFIFLKLFLGTALGGKLGSTKDRLKFERSFPGKKINAAPVN